MEAQASTPRSRRRPFPTFEPPEPAASTKPEIQKPSAEAKTKGIAADTLVEWHELPAWQKDNEYLQTGYRPPTNSFKACLRSLGYLHNETINIYSHLLASLLFATLPLYIFHTILPTYPTTGSADLVVLSTFFYSVALCFLFSAIFHIINNHSARVSQLGNQLDYLGIVLLMWGSTIPSIYYGFYCDPKLQRAYWTNICVLAIACSAATFHPSFRNPTWRPYRAAMYAALGLSAVVFVAHGLLKHGWEVQNERMGVGWMGLMALLNLGGAVAYAARVPERWYPRRFDIVGCSHQTLHVMVVFAGLAHMAGLLRALSFVHGRDDVCT